MLFKFKIYHCFLKFSNFNKTITIISFLLLIGTIVIVVTNIIMGSRRKAARIVIAMNGDLQLTSVT